MILKVCTRDEEHWFPGFSDGLSSRRSFSVRRGQNVMAAFQEKYGDQLPAVVHLLGFEELEDEGDNYKEFKVEEMVGKLLVGHRDGKEVTEGWLVPANSCFLLSETGKTVDRI